MVIEIRIYKRHDPDLVALCDNGYPVKEMLKEACKCFAYGQPLHYILDEIVPFEEEGKKSVHTRFRIPDSDIATCNMLKAIKKGYRNNFCKALLRNALVQQNLSAYFRGSGWFELSDKSLDREAIKAMSNLIKGSTIREAGKQVSFLSHTVTVHRDSAYDIDVEKPAKQHTPEPEMNQTFTDINTPALPDTEETAEQAASLQHNEEPDERKAEQIRTEEDILADMLDNL